MTQQELQEYIVARIYPNNAQEITGASLQEVLLAIVANSQNEEEATEALAQLATEIGEIEDAVEQNTTDIATKQETLTLTVKNNGNIVIGNFVNNQSVEFMPATPSGDPMHYAYEVVGAVYNATSGFWTMYDITDITNDQMRGAYINGFWNLGEVSPFANLIASTRFTFPRTGANTATAYSFYAFAFANASIEVINVGNSKNLDNRSEVNVGANIANAFNGCSALRVIGGGALNVASASVNYTAFRGCYSLETVWVKGLKWDVSFADSPLSVESATYLLQNADSTAQFTVTFRADRQAIYEANAEFVTALNDKPNITILYQ